MFYWKAASLSMLHFKRRPFLEFINFENNRRANATCPSYAQIQEADGADLLHEFQMFSSGYATRTSTPQTDHSIAELCRSSHLGLACRS